MSLGWLTESALMPRRPKEIEDVGKASMVDMRAALYQTESAARHPDGAASAALREQRQRRARRTDPLAASSNRGVSERDASAARQEREDEARSAEAMARKVAMYEAMTRGEQPGEAATDARGRSACSLATSAASLVDFELKQLKGDGDLLRLRGPSGSSGGSGGCTGGEAGRGAPASSMSSSSMRREDERREWEQDARREIASSAAESGAKQSHAEMTNLTRETGIARASASDQRAKRQRALEDRRATLRLKQEARCRAAEGESGDSPRVGACAAGDEESLGGGSVREGAHGAGVLHPEGRESYGGAGMPPPATWDSYGAAWMPHAPAPYGPPHSAFPPPHAPHGAMHPAPLPPAPQPVAHVHPGTCSGMAPAPSCPALPQHTSRARAWQHPPPPTAAPATPAPMGDDDLMRAMGLPSSFTSSARAEAEAATQAAAEQHQAAVQAAWAAYLGQGSMYSGQGAWYGHGAHHHYQYPGHATAHRESAMPRTVAPRKLVIKPLKTAPRLPENFELATWAKLRAAVQAVHGKRPVTHSLEELYRGVEDMCLQNMAARTYERLEAECESHIQASIEALRGQTPDARAFLSLMHGCWTAHCEEMLTLRSVFLYLDRTYVMQTANKKSLWEMGLASFRTHLSARPDVLAKLRGGLLALIEAERNGDAVQRSLISDLLRMLYDLGLYQRHFEEAFLAATTAFYQAEGNAKLHSLDVPSLLLHIKARLVAEEQRVSHYLHVSSRRPLMAAVRHTLLAVHVAAILDKGFSSLVDQSRLEDLGRMYSLFAQVDALPALRHAFGVYIKRVGTALVSDPERERVMVAELLAMKAKLDAVMAAAFNGKELFGNTLKESFEQFINVRQNKPAELLARHLDAQLRAGNKGSGDDELEGSLNKAMTLFRYIDGKDMFEAFYKKDLSKRLLLDKSASIDAEKSMISKLKAECGSAFTTKLEGMFKDIDLSKDVMASFRASAHAAQVPPSVELAVHVLTQGYWPTYSPVEVNLPREILELQTIFSSFYMSKHNGRRLLWHPYLGHCTLRANFPLGRKEMAVSLLQTIVLLLFNDGDGFSYPHLLQATGIEDKELKVTLQSLACGKVRALRKEPKGRNVDETDIFFFDSSFKHSLFRIKINSIQMRETEAETEQTSERVFQDRQYQIDAAIVRVMKARKTLAHSILMAELFQQLKFPLKPADLKKRIESLIDREYLERDPASASTYRYLA